MRLTIQLVGFTLLYILFNTTVIWASQHLQGEKTTVRKHKYNIMILFLKK